MVKLGEFLDKLYSPLPSDCVICLSSPSKQYSNTWVNASVTPKDFRTLDNPEEWYVCSSLIDKQDPPLKRKREHLRYARVLVLDDIGTKAKEPPVMPSAILETSPNNYQYIYRLSNQNVADNVGYAQVVALLKACAEAGYTDAAGLHPGRVMRVPGSINKKYDKDFVTQLTHWKPHKCWKIDELANQLGLELNIDLSVTGLPSKLNISNDFKDVVMDWLVDMKLASPVKNNWASIICPWTANHTPGRDDFAGYKPLGIGENILFRGFKCHHEHCKSKTTEAFLLWVHEQGGPLVKPNGVDELPLDVIRETSRKLPVHERRELFRASIPHLHRGNLPDVVLTSKGEAAAQQIPTQDNIAWLMESCDVMAKMNVMTREVELTFNDLKKKELVITNEHEQCYRTIVDQSLKLGIRGNRKDLDDTIEEFAYIEQYHPFENYIRSVKWDGIGRFKDLCDTVTVSDKFRYVWPKYLKRWLVQTIQAGCGWKNPKQMSGVLIFVGRQNLGKTEWLKSLAPEPYRQEGVVLDLRGYTAKDTVIRATMFPIVEIGEMDATFRVSDIAALKNFLGLSHDVYRAPHGRKTRRWPRASSYFGSVNNTQFLNDETGSRRFWPVTVHKVNHNHDINMQQVWAEAYTWWKSGMQWWLDDEENELRRVNSQVYQVIDTSVELAEAYLANHDAKETVCMNATEFAQVIGARLNPKTKGLLAAYLDKRVAPRKQIQGKRNAWMIPVAAVEQTYLEEVKVEDL